MKAKLVSVLLAGVLPACTWPALPTPSADSGGGVSSSSDSATVDSPGVDTDASPGGVLWDVCDGTHACAQGYVCELSTSADGSGICLGDEGTSCEDDAACAASRAYVCLPVAPHQDAQVCAPRSGPAETCREDDDCASGLCGEASETCAADLGAACMSDEDCLAPGTCRYDADGARRCELNGGMGDYCDNAADCADGRACSGGACEGFAGEEGCVADTECPEGTVCRANGSGLGACLEPAERAGTACADEDECGDGLVCVDSVCLAEAGAECVDASDCSSSSNVCYSGYCTAPVPEGSSCQDSSGLPDASICEEGLLCSGATLTCVAPGSLEDGDACGSDEECGDTATGDPLVCNVWTSTCAIAGPAINSFTASDVISLTAAGDAWSPWSCHPFPTVDIPQGYASFTFIDSVSHESHGENTTAFLAVVDDATGQVCANVRGYRDPNPFDPFDSGGPPTELSFRVNTLVYNPSLIAIDGAGRDETYRAPDCPEVPSGLPDGVSGDVPCQTATEYWAPVTVPAGWEAVGMVDVRGYVPGGEYGSFVQTVAALSEMAISEDYIGIAVDRTMLFAGSYDSMCGGYVSVAWDVIRWRTGLPAMARAGRYQVRQPGGAVTQNLSDLGDAGGPHLSWLGIQSYNLDTTKLPDDEFWNWCGSFSSGGVSCDVQPSDSESEAFPYENEIQSILDEAAKDGTVDVCTSLGATVDLCDIVGLGVKKIADLIFNALFPDPCGSGNDKDADWELSKEEIGDGWAYTYDAFSGEDTENADAGISAEILDLNFSD